MDTKTFARLLDGREHDSVISAKEEAFAKQKDIIVVYRASDNLIKFCGATKSKINLCLSDGIEETTLDIKSMGFVQSPNKLYFDTTISKSVTINIKKNKKDYPLVFEADFPHECFDVLRRGNKYCKGIVFFGDDLAPYFDFRFCKQCEKMFAYENYCPKCGEKLCRNSSIT